VVRHLFWPLLYWCDPDAYLELAAGEELPVDLVDGLALDGEVVADLGAGAGRFVLLAAGRARRVIAVAAVPALLCRLTERAATTGAGNIEVRLAQRGRRDHSSVPGSPSWWVNPQGVPVSLQLGREGGAEVEGEVETILAGDAAALPHLRDPSRDLGIRGNWPGDGLTRTMAVSW
jgi:hypothetical protein